jgi:hypothetical protein
MPKHVSFKKTQCEICGQIISTAGAAHTSHMRMHVKRKEAIEFKRDNRLTFMTESQHNQYIEDHPYARLGEAPLPGQPPGIWELPNISKELPTIDPSSYFITSGEAVKKAEKLVKDLYSVAVKARSFRDKLVKARGIKKYLETSREDNRLLIKRKDPRNRK